MNDQMITLAQDRAFRKFEEVEPKASACLPSNSLIAVLDTYKLALIETNEMKHVHAAKRTGCGCDGAYMDGCPQCWSHDELRLRYQALVAAKEQAE